jgi:hypothetical protein
MHLFLNAVCVADEQKIPIANTKNPIKGVGLVEGHHISGVFLA